MRLKTKLCVGEDRAADPPSCQGWGVGETREYSDPLVILY
jgi:hypothetical protein